MNNPFVNAMEQLDKAGNIVSINKEILLKLKTPDKFLKAPIPVRMDNGELKIFIGHRVQYDNS